MTTQNTTAKKNTIKVAANSKSVCCPPKGQELWNLHPRVYLDIEKSREVKCPYCGNHFELQAD